MLNPGGGKQEVTIMITDPRGFTAIGEPMRADEVDGIINICLEVMKEIILKDQGFTFVKCYL